jgi:hypothetical protein
MYLLLLLLISFTSVEANSPVSPDDLARIGEYKPFCVRVSPGKERLMAGSILILNHSSHAIISKVHYYLGRGGWHLQLLSLAGEVLLSRFLDHGTVCIVEQDSIFMKTSTDH